jgi:hypothetical protein
VKLAKTFFDDVALLAIAFGYQVSARQPIDGEAAGAMERSFWAVLWHVSFVVTIRGGTVCHRIYQY